MKTLDEEFTKREPTQICAHCGSSVAWGSGKYVNRIPEFNDIETRQSNGLAFPHGDYVCEECDKKTTYDD
jgi:hypothetical protein